MKKLLVLLLFPTLLIGQVTNKRTGLSYATIQEAIDVLFTGGTLDFSDTLDVANGTYPRVEMIADFGLDMNGYELWIIGTGSSAIIDGGDSVSSLIRLSEISGTHWESLTLQNGDPLGEDGALIYITGDNAGASSKTKNNTFTNLVVQYGYVGFRMINHTDTTIFQSCIWSDLSYGAYRVGSPDANRDSIFNLWILNNTFSTADTAPNGEGSTHGLFKDTKGLRVEDCFFDVSTRNALSINTSYNFDILRNEFRGSGTGNQDNPASIIYVSEASPLGDGYANIINNKMINNQGEMLRIEAIDTLRVYSNTMIDKGRIRNRSYVNTLVDIGYLEWYNNVLYSDTSLTVAINNIYGTPDLVPDTNFFADYNDYHHNWNPSRRVWNGEGALSGYSEALDNIQATGQEANSNYYDHTFINDSAIGFRLNDLPNILTNPVNWHLKTLAVDGFESKARKTGNQSKMPELDNRRYTRADTSDLGAYDMSGIPPIEPTLAFNVYLNDVLQSEAFAVEDGDTVTLIDVSTDITNRTFQIINDNLAEFSSNDSVYDFPVTSAQNKKSYTLRMIGSNSETDFQGNIEKINWMVGATPPVIIGQAANQDVSAGETVNLYVTDTGSFPNRTIQWQVNTGLGYVDVSGATDSTYSFVAESSQDGDLFRAIVSNLSSSDTTTDILVEVEAVDFPPVITAQPQNSSVFEGGTVVFSVTATGSPAFTYQWQIDTVGSFEDITGATNQSYSKVVALSDSGQAFRVIVSNTVGNTFSNTAYAIVSRQSIDTNDADGVKVIDQIVPNSPLDAYPTHNDQYGKGGWRSVETIAERNSITTDRRRVGMVVFVSDSATEYQLISGITNSDWQELLDPPTDTTNISARITANYDTLGLHLIRLNNIDDTTTALRSDINNIPQVDTNSLSDRIDVNTDSIVIHRSELNALIDSIISVKLLIANQGLNDVIENDSSATHTAVFKKTQHEEILINGFFFNENLFTLRTPNGGNNVGFRLENSADGNYSWALDRLNGGVFTIRYSLGYPYGEGGTITPFTIDPLNFGLVDINFGLDLTGDLTMSGYIKPFTSTDAAAPNNSIYYSSDQSKLVYKDGAGVVNNLY
jgi:hypothetical protein